MRQNALITWILVGTFSLLPHLVFGKTIVVPSTANKSFIQESIDAAENGDHIIIEPGVYSITTLLIFKSNVNITGRYENVKFTAIDSDNIFEFRATELQNTTIQGIIFSNIRINFNGDSSHSKIKNVIIRSCQFTDGKSKNSTGSYYIRIMYGDGLTIENCTFQRSFEYPGTGIKLLYTHNVTINNCKFGFMGLGGFFKTAINVGGAIKNTNTGDFPIKHRCKNIKIKNNTILRNPATSFEDHGIYAWGMYGIEIDGNYILGWNDSKSGGAINVRNGERIRITNNILERSGIHMYTHKTASTPIPEYFRDVYVSDNKIILWEKYYSNNPRYKGIIYSCDQNLTGEKPYERNIRIINNEITEGNIRIRGELDVQEFNADSGGVFNNIANEFILVPEGIQQSGNIIWSN